MLATRVRISIIFGTRPELIKLFPVIKSFKARTDCEIDVCFTGQHKEMVLQLLDFFQLSIDYNLELMEANQTLSGLTSKAISALDAYYLEKKPDIVFVQGDTTTALCAAQVAFYHKIKVAHVEAGLRTNDIYSPFPEEFNRLTISTISNFHFAPTRSAAINLANEGYPETHIITTGNTVIDTLFFTLDKLKASPELVNGSVLPEKPFILITGHRRENHGKGIISICRAIKELAIKYTSLSFVYPVHLNPNIKVPVSELLGDIENVQLLEPLNYVEFVYMMANCKLIVTDSGGVQEEAPSLGKPIIVTRESTERPEAIDAGVAVLVGSSEERIIAKVSELIENNEVYESMSKGVNPYGDGKASERIVAETLRLYQL